MALRPGLTTGLPLSWNLDGPHASRKEDEHLANSSSRGLRNQFIQKSRSSESWSNTQSSPLAHVRAKKRAAPRGR
jgi:hypothetical protein